MKRAVWSSLFLALVLSGVAGIINQVVWQRALKIFLGGSETLSAMVVVLVFMLGLGLGAGLTGQWAHRLRYPLRWLMGVEAGLAVINIGVAILLGLDISESVYAVQRLAVSAGLPVRAVYAIGSMIVLLPPTILMGSTVPLASEGLQRQLGATSSRLVPVLFFVNTFGAAGGAFGASFYLLPYYGQRSALYVAVGFNLVAAVFLAAGTSWLPAAEPGEDPSGETAGRRGGLTVEEWVGGMLGFLSLGYEMYLFRVLALAHEPLPYTFATGLAFFLLFWSIGVAIAGRIPSNVAAVGLVTATLAAAMPSFYAADRFVYQFDLYGGALVYYLPCIGFGILYGLFVSRAAKRWGRDVGRYYAVNTVGSCLGILLFTLVGYEMPQDLVAWVIALGLVVTVLLEQAATREEGGAARITAAVFNGIAAAGLVLYGLSLAYTGTEKRRTYWGRDGVVEVEPSGDVYIDGLWHTKLARKGEHIGRPYSWVMAMAAVMAHRDVPLERALVIGAGVGVSSVTLAGVNGLQVDGYEINHTLKRILRDYPAWTLHAANLPNVHWTWRDARTGLALNETKYDIILSAPLHLRQAGSSLLLSKEYFRLAKSRLKPDGVLAVYSNEGEDEQSWLVQRTIAETFKSTDTWYDGIVTVASDQLVRVTEEMVNERMTRPDPLYQQMKWLDENRDGGLWYLHDSRRMFDEVADRPITDDHPLVEYPEIAAKMVKPVDVESVSPD